MYKIDNQWRIKLPEGLLELSQVKNAKQIVLAQEDEKTFQVIDVKEIPDDAKIVTGSINITESGRIFVPSVLRKRFSEVKNVQIYVKAKKLYIEF